MYDRNQSSNNAELQCRITACTTLRLASSDDPADFAASSFIKISGYNDYFLKRNSIRSNGIETGSETGSGLLLRRRRKVRPADKF